MAVVKAVEFMMIRVTEPHIVLDFCSCCPLLDRRVPLQILNDDAISAADCASTSCARAVLCVKVQALINAQIDSLDLFANMSHYVVRPQCVLRTCTLLSLKSLHGFSFIQPHQLLSQTASIIRIYFASIRADNNVK
jgi:hypothetical protein